MTRIRTAVIGCGSVSEPYLQDLTKSPFVDLVAVCDIAPERAVARAREFAIPHAFVNIDALLAGPSVDFVIVLTGMQAHFEITRRMLAAGKHVLCEKPLGGTRAEGRALLDLAKAKRVQLFGAPNAVTSPAFAFLAEQIGAGRLGRIVQAHGRYGHGGPNWGPWFYQEGGGALFDLGVYNVTFLTGLLGPAKGVVALCGTAIPEREVEGQRIAVEAEDNAIALIDHGDCVYSSVSTGFAFGPCREDSTIQVIGTQGSANLLGWDWKPGGVELRSAENAGWETHCVDQQGYCWEGGGSHIAECLATGKPTRMTPEHALHTLDILLAAKESAATGQRIEIESTFPWPSIGSGPAGAATTAALDPVRHNR